MAWGVLYVFVQIQIIKERGCEKKEMMGKKGTTTHQSLLVLACKGRRRKDKDKAKKGSRRP